MRKKTPLNWWHDLSLTIDASELNYHLAGTGDIGPDGIHVSEAHFSTATGQHSRLELSGDVNGQPVIAAAIIEGRQGSKNESSRYPFTLNLQSATTFMDINGFLTLPFKRNRSHFKLNLKSDALNQLNPFLGVDLPPVGPYNLTGTLLIDHQGYQLSDLSLQVGQSHLTGNLDYTTASAPPQLLMNLEADLIQIDDFKLDDWSPTGKDSPENKADKGDNRGPSNKKARNELTLISRDLVKGLNGELEVLIKEARSGEDRLGRAQLKATINGDNLEIAPLFLELPGGSINARFHFNFDSQQVISSARISIDQLEYGIVARRKDKDSKAGGLLSLEVDLESQAESVEQFMAHANGRMDISLQPHNIDAQVMEYWVTNLIFSILPLVNVGKESKVNCAAVHMDMDNGKMTQDRILIDTTRMQVGGKAELDFKQRTITAVLKPRPKRAQFLSLATPIHISGDFSDFQPKIKTKHLIGTAIHLLTSAITVPFNWLIFGRIPADGEEACRSILPRMDSMALPDFKR